MLSGRSLRRTPSVKTHDWHSLRDLGPMVDSGRRHHAAAMLVHVHLKTSKFFRSVDLGAG
jgi:hypothetical protein